MRKVIIVSGHGNYATGIQSTLELLAGKDEDLLFIDFLADDTDVNLREKFTAAIEVNKGSEILFICDILGGTPFKIAGEVSNSSENMELVAGCNVGGILDKVLIKDSLTLRELADGIVEGSKNSTMRFEKIDVNSIKTTDVSFEDGI
jgi:N-acetylgalactosamine PTS system EIIA component